MTSFDDLALSLEISFAATFSAKPGRPSSLTPQTFLSSENDLPESFMTARHGSTPAGWNRNRPINTKQVDEEVPHAVTNTIAEARSLSPTHDWSIKSLADMNTHRTASQAASPTQKLPVGSITSPATASPPKSSVLWQQTVVSNGGHSGAVYSRPSTNCRQEFRSNFIFRAQLLSPETVKHKQRLAALPSDLQLTLPRVRALFV
ncbi:uncharacterized protein PV09_05166 [Verruconis gallopava]|uniref:Uncharacterized protein n=1 Tax=Verruconis gallopava TaxID=253628 RepID=A0A0D2ABA9_9PEZI|nr:uncharacterized protein PV09_05166 [Verruconis gallopava]KIW03870.1 hypothetical protein PV09_05166 [Verruconis gallopava]